MLERAAKKGLMKGTKRSKKDSKIRREADAKDKQTLDEIPKDVLSMAVVSDKKEEDKKVDSKNSWRTLNQRNSMKPFQF